MVENPTSKEFKEIETYNNEPQKHVEVIKEIGPLNDVDLDKYFIGYSFDMSENAINSFYGGFVVKMDDEDYFDRDVSEKQKEKTKERFEWVSSFEYTPKELKSIAGEFLKEFKDGEDSLNTFKDWRDVRDRWVNILRKGSIYELRRGNEYVEGKDGKIHSLNNEGKYKKHIDYYREKNADLLKQNVNFGLRVR